MVLYSKIRPYLVKIVRPTFQGLCSADIYPLLPNNKFITKDYLYYVLFTKQFTDYANAGSARAGMPKVNRDHLFNFQFYIPDLETQHRFTTSLDNMSPQTTHLISIYQQKLTLLTELKQALLAEEFGGV
jgi:type I restriction enzyme S subunit